MTARYTTADLGWARQIVRAPHITNHQLRAACHVLRNYGDVDDAIVARELDNLRNANSGSEILPATRAMAPRLVELNRPQMARDRAAEAGRVVAAVILAAAFIALGVMALTAANGMEAVLQTNVEGF